MDMFDTPYSLLIYCIVRPALQNGEVIGITSIEFSTSGTDLIYLITHNKDYDIKNIYVLNIIMGRVEDQIERMIYR